MGIDTLLLCLIRAIRKYLSRTEPYRPRCTNLFVSAIKRSKQVFQSFISFWTKLLIFYVVLPHPLLLLFIFILFLYSFFNFCFPYWAVFPAGDFGFWHRAVPVGVCSLEWHNNKIDVQFPYTLVWKLHTQACEIVAGTKRKLCKKFQVDICKT